MQVNDELVYKNGAVYKQLAVASIEQSDTHEYSTELVDGSVLSTYPWDGTKLVFQFSSIKTSADAEYIKTYNHTSDLDVLLGTTDGSDLAAYDLSPDCLFIATGSIDDVVTELYFAIESNTDLIKIADYYSLVFPLPTGETVESSWSSRILNRFTEQLGDDHPLINNLLIGSVIVDGTTATGLKMYRFGNVPS